MTAKVGRGFTLLEVMVALAVVAIALSAIIKAAGESANNVSYLRNQTLAGWVGLNQVNQILLQRDWPGEGSLKGTTEMAGREWRWEIRISNTSDEDLRRLDVTVRGQDDDMPLSELIAFKGRPEQ